VTDGLDTIDARADGLAPSDVIFIFGTRMDAPAVIAAELFHCGFAPLVVATGGAGRQHDHLNSPPRASIRSLPTDMAGAAATRRC
jgi:hypothetical protein